MSDDGRRHWLGGIGDAFADRNFCIYSLGSIGSWVSYFVQLVAVSWLTWQLTGSTAWLAAMALFDIVPNVVLLPLTGALADRYDRHAIMIVTSVLLLIQAGAMAVLSWAGLLTIWPLVGLVLVHGVLISFMVPAMYGTLPRFVNRAVLSSAIAVAASYTQLAVFVGPAIAGWIIASHGLTPAFAVNALGYVALLAAFLFLRTPPDYRRPQRSARSILGDIAEGFAYIRRDRTLSSLLLLGLVADSLAIGFYHMVPAYADDVLGLGVVGVATVLACRGGGATVAALWLAHAGGQAARVGRIFWATLAAMLALAALIHIPMLLPAALVACVWGFAGETRKTSTFSIIQLAVDEQQRGRVMGTVFMFSQLAAGIGVYAIGTLAGHLGLRVPISAGVLFGICVWWWLYRRYRRERVGRLSDLRQV